MSQQQHGDRRLPTATTAICLASLLLFGLRASAAEPVEATETEESPVRIAEADAAADAPVYEVTCSDEGCVVDKATYVGWRTYHNACHVCHAQDAVGSTFAPSLIDRLQIIDKERFYDSLANGYTGQMGVMPPWKNDPNVNTRFDELYAYLKARSDGALGPGRPTRKR